MAIEIISESLAGARPELTGEYKKSPLAGLSESPSTGQRSSQSRFRLTNWSSVRRNFSSRARELSGGDAIILSIPKSGRTWVRTFLCAYFCKRYDHSFSLQPEEYGDGRIPRIIYSHDRFEQRTKADRWDKLIRGMR